MSVSVSQFSRGKRGSAMRFVQKGDFIDGHVLDAAMVDDQHNAGETVFKLQIVLASARVDGDDVDVPPDADVMMDLYVRSAGLQDALGEAVGDAGCESVDPGAPIRAEYVADKALPSGRVMKLYEASYSPPAPIGVGVLGETTEAVPF